MDIVDIVLMGMYWFMMYCTVLFFMIFMRHRKSFFSDAIASRLPSLSFIVPAYNEEKHISRCIQTLMNIDYPAALKKIIVINDGSKDRTAEIAQEYADKGLIRLVNKPNTGKANSINSVLPSIDTELVAIMDADSFPEPSFTKNLVGYFDDPQVAAAVPAIKPMNADTIVRKIQWVEYMFQIYLRRIFDFFRCQYVVPGAGSIYRTAVISRLGFDEKDNLTEDTEIGFRLQREGLKIKNSLNSIVYTDVPGSLKELYSQRVRWYRGYIQNVMKYKDMVGNRRYGNFGFFLLPANFIWIAIIFLLFSITVFNYANDAFRVAKAWIALDFSILIPRIDFSQILFTMDVYSYIWVVFLVMGIITVLLGLFSSKEDVGFKSRKTFYFAYFLFYPLLLMTFWIASVMSEVLKVKRKW